MQSPPVEHGGRIRFPALDPEPPPPPWWRRLLGLVVFLAIAGLVAGAITFAPSLLGQGRKAGPHARTPAVPIAASGTIVAETSSGDLVLADPQGGAVKIPGLGPNPPFPPVAASADGRYLVSPAGGTVFPLGHLPRLVAAHDTLSFPTRLIPATLGPLAGHDRYLVIVDNTYGSGSTKVVIRLGSLATGRIRFLGLGDQVAGDPAAPGVFASIAAPPAARGQVSSVFPDARLVRWDAGAKPVVLATASRLAHEVGLAPGTPVTLLPFPSPDGSQVAVEVQSLPAVGQQRRGIVVLSRSGQVTGSVLVALGALGPAAWSPSGAALAYVTPGTNGRALSVWQIGGQSATMPLPLTGAPYGRCVWSPNGVLVMCSDPQGREWALAQTAGGQSVGLRGRGLPIAWVATAP